MSDSDPNVVDYAINILVFLASMDDRGEISFIHMNQWASF